MAFLLEDTLVQGCRKLVRLTLGRLTENVRKVGKFQKEPFETAILYGARISDVKQYFAC